MGINKKIKNFENDIIQDVLLYHKYPIEILNKIDTMTVLKNITEDDEFWRFLLGDILISNKQRLFSIETNKIIYDKFTKIEPTLVNMLLIDNRYILDYRREILDIYKNEEIIDNEVWKFIPNSAYLISTKGRLYSVKHRRMKSFYASDKNRYINAIIHDINGEKIYTSLHRLVAQAFIPNPENKLIVNHIDGNKQNNCVENLEWCTYQENMDHAVRIGLLNVKGVNNANNKYTKKDVIRVCELSEMGLLPREIIRITNYSKAFVHSILSKGEGKQWKHISKNYNLTKPDQHGMNNATSLLDDEEVRRICELNIAGVSTKRIADMLNRKYDTIHSIIHGETWSHITKDYNLIQHSNVKYTEEQIRKVCEMLSENKYTYEDIKNITNIPRDTVRDICRNKSWKYISKDYNIKWPIGSKSITH